MSYIAGLLGGLDARRRETAAESRAREDKLADLEFGILSQLAQGDDDEIAALAGAGILETLAGNNKITRAKGLRGFLGEVDRSSYLPGIREVLKTRGQQPPTPATPGGAALPAGSPVEPARQPPFEMPIVSRQGLGVAPGQVQTGPPTAPGGGGAGLGPGMVPGNDSPSPLPATGFPATPFAGASLPPPPPEAPAERFARLYPSASETAAAAKASSLLAEYEAKLRLFQRAQTPEERQFVSGMFGSPSAQFRPTAVLATYIDQDGIERTEAGELREGGRVFVGGREVRTSKPPQPLTQRQSRPIVGRSYRNAQGNEVVPYYDPDTMELLYEQDRNMPPQAPNPFIGAPVYMQDGSMGMVARPTTPGAAPKAVPIEGAVPPPKAPRSTSPTTTEAAREAKLLLQKITEEAKRRALARHNPMFGGQAKPLELAELDAVTREVSKGRFSSHDAVRRVAAGLTPEDPGAAPTAPAGPPALGSQEAADAIRAELLKRQGKPR